VAAALLDPASRRIFQRGRPQQDRGSCSKFWPLRVSVLPAVCSPRQVNVPHAVNCSGGQHLGFALAACCLCGLQSLSQPLMCRNIYVLDEGSLLWFLWYVLYPASWLVRRHAPAAASPV